MPTPKNAPYKIRQREQGKWFARIWDMAKIRLALKDGPGTVKTKGGRTYIIDPVTGQWWRPEKWAARQRR